MLREQLSAQAEAICQLTHQLDWFKKQLFGPKSEKQVYDLPEQDSLFQPKGTSLLTPDGSRLLPVVSSA